MSGKVKVFKGSKDKVFQQYLDIVNNFLSAPLTNLEKKILTLFYMLGGINKDTKRVVRKVFKFYSYSALDNYIVSMKKKGVIVGEYTDVKINPNIDVKDKEFNIMLKFIIE